MGTTDAVLYLRPRLVSAPAVGGKTGAVMLAPIRASSGLFTSADVRSSQASTLRSSLPGARHPVTIGGQPMDPSWYKFFQTFVDVFLGSAGQYTLPEVIAAVQEAQQQGATQEARVNTLADMSGTNADVLNAVVQVAKNNSLTGADQIPPPRLGGFDMV